MFVRRFVSTDKARIPTHKQMEKARHDTFLFAKGWKHDKTPNHGANSKMVGMSVYGLLRFSDRSFLRRWHKQGSFLRLNMEETTSLHAFIVIHL